MYRITFAAIVLLSHSNHTFAAEGLPSVPRGFVVEEVAKFPLVEHPMMGGFDDQGRLYLAESAGHNLRSDDLLADPPNFIRRLEDTDGDGSFDQSVLFADKMTLPMGALWYRGSLYVASPPYIWRLEDTDDDGQADVREIVAGTFGFNGNAASVHGCFLSPDGRIFWCDGRHGHKFEDETGQILSQGKAARIFSCRPDGSDIRTFCGGGMDNPVEVDFTDHGEVIGTVNILYSRPRIDALVHWLPDGVYPREDQGDCIAEFDHTGSLMTPITSYGHVAVSGTTRYRSKQFGKEYQDNFFVSVFNTHRVVRSVLTPRGSTWSSQDEDFLVSDDPNFHPTDVIEDADGSLLIIDTGGWFRIGCPTSQTAKPEFKGAIYRIRKQGAHQVEDARGESINWKTLSVSAIEQRLDDARFAVRKRAIDELALKFREDRSSLIQRMDALNWPQQTSRFQRNYLWAISRITPEQPLTEPQDLKLLLSVLDQSEESARTVALKVLIGIAPPNDIYSMALEQLSQASAHDQRIAIRCLEELLSPRESGASSSQRSQVTAKILSLLEAPKLDRHLEHTITHALLKIGDVKLLEQALGHDRPVVRRNALIAMSQHPVAQLQADDVFAQLALNDQQLQQEALRVLEAHPEWIDKTHELLVDWLTADSVPADREAMLRGFLQATFDRPEIQTSLRETLSKKTTSPSIRRYLLKTLNQVASDQFEQDWSLPLSVCLQDSNSETQLLTLQLIGKLNITDFDDRIFQIFQQAEDSPTVAAEALKVLAPRFEPLPSTAFDFLLEGLSDGDQTLASLAAAQTLTHCVSLTASQQSVLRNSFSQLPTHVLPALQPVVLQSNRETQQAYLQTILDQGIADRFSSSDWDHWSAVSESSNLSTLVREITDQRELAIGERTSKLADLLIQLTDGDPAQGKRIFQSQKAACSGCHRVEQNGGQIGPNLTQIGRIRTHRDLLEAIVYPSVSFARGYEPYTVVTETGRSYSGVIQSETAGEIVLVTTDLRTIRISRDEIEILKLSPVSVMPRGIDQLLSQNELRDLLAYLKSRQ